MNLLDSLHPRVRVAYTLLNLLNLPNLLGSKLEPGALLVACGWIRPDRFWSTRPSLVSTAEIYNISFNYKTETIYVLYLTDNSWLVCSLQYINPYKSFSRRGMMQKLIGMIWIIYHKCLERLLLRSVQNLCSFGLKSSNGNTNNHIGSVVCDPREIDW